MSLVGLGLMVFCGQSLSEKAQECASGQFYSSFSSTCERAALQIGLGNQVNSFSVGELAAKYKEAELIMFKNPAYQLDDTVNKVRKYKGVRLKNVIESILPAGESLEGYVLATTCLDGFNPVLDSNVLHNLEKTEALIAYEQINIKGAKAGISKDGKWELVTTEWGIQSPAPFYLVWSQSQGTYPQAWPFQLNSMRLIKAIDYKNALDRLRPAREFLGKKPPTEIEDGYSQFAGKCMTCHQINGVGGQKAKIDLKALFNALQTDEEARTFLERIVVNPPAGMSEIKGMKLTDDDIRHLAAYLRYISVER